MASEPLHTGQQGKATRRDWIGLAIIALPCMVYAMDLTVLNLALPVITAQFKPSGAQLLWMVDIYGFMVAGFLITMGTIGDRIGRRRLLMYGAVAFAVASALAAWAQSAAMLIALRALLGISGATLAPSTLSLIRNMFRDDQQRRFAIGVWIASFSLGGVIGPLIGGVLLHFFGWPAVFLAAVPVMGLLLLLGPALLPEFRDPGAGRVDALSVGLSVISVLTTVFALKQMAEYGLSRGLLTVLAAGLLLGVVFVRRQRTLAYPLLDLTLFAQTRFRGAIAAYALSCLAMFGTYILITQYLQLVLGLTALEAGAATIPWSLGFALGSLVSPRLGRWLGAERVLLGGLVAAALGFVLVALVEADRGLGALIAGTVIMSLGMAPVFTIGNELIITSASPERAGAASALSETVSEFSGALGIALFGSIGSVLYRRGLDLSLPEGIPANVIEAARATLGGALDVAHGLAPELARALVLAARVAFVDALRVTLIAGAVLAVLAAVLTARIFRQR